MNNILILLLMTSSAFANLLSDNTEDFNQIQHENPGCPINSLCSKENADIINKWEKMLSMADSKSLNRKIREFKNKHGIPLEFLIHNDFKENKDPVLFKSRCKIHNPSNPNNKIFRGFKFLKKYNKKDNFVFDKVLRKNDKSTKVYHIPYQDIPIMILNDKLIITKDYDDDFYQLAVSEDGKLEVIDIKVKELRRAMNFRVKETKCSSKLDIDKNYHMNTYCQKIWNKNTNTLEEIQLSWSCP